MIIYEFLYNSSTEESSYATMSLHRTKEGAEKAMEKHKAKERRKWNKMYKNQPELIKKMSKFGQYQDWTIGEQKLLD